MAKHLSRLPRTPDAQLDLSVEEVDVVVEALSASLAQLLKAKTGTTHRDNAIEKKIDVIRGLLKQIL